MRKVDLLIIGSGPAGLSAALHLLQQDPGWSKRMILIEKESHPRPKLCAGGVTRIGLETLRDLDIQLPLPIPGVTVEEARLKYKNRKIRLRRKPVFVVYDRMEFDAYLCEVARTRGANIQEGESVQGIVLTEQGMQVETTRGKYLAQVVLGADGSKGVSRRYLSNTGTQSIVARLLEGVYPDQTCRETFARRLAIFDFTWSGEDLQGYTWKFPSKVDGVAHWNVGVYDARIASKRKRADLPGILDRSLVNENSSVVQEQVQGHPLTSFNPGRRISSPRFLAVGDAAGVDGLFGEGIGPSLAYGNLAAQEISSAFSSGDFSFKQYKNHLLRSALGDFLLIRWLIAWLSYHLGRFAIYMHNLWFIGMIAAALWKEDEWFYPPDSQKGETKVNRQQRTRIFDKDTA